MTTQTLTGTSQITYTKLHSGEWGLRGHGLSSGTSVTVTKRDGSRKTETVGRILWTGQDGTQLATIGGSSHSHSRASSSPRTRRDGRYECEECGDYVYPGSSCWETGMTH